MNKLKILSILFSIVILTLLVVGCGNKVTGGGWFIGTETQAAIDTEGNYVTFGFNMQPVGESYTDPVLGEVIDAKGQFQLIDHTFGTRIHGTISTALVDLNVTTTSVCMGTCSIDGSGSYDGSYTFMAAFTDATGWDFISLFVDLDGDWDLEKDTDLFYDGLLDGVSGGGAIRINVAK